MWMNKRMRALLAAGLVALAAPGWADPAADQSAVRQVLMSQFDKPEARLQVEPVVVSGDTALASWAQGERGGRALLRRHKGHWGIAVCGGDGLKEVALLKDAGVPASDAKALVAALQSAESRLTAQQRARFASFDGLVKMDAQGAHPKGH